MEKIETLPIEEVEVYRFILEGIQKHDFGTAYSNAHINDLVTAFNNSPKGEISALTGHLENIRRLTKDIYICQYWGQKTVKIEKRSIYEVMASAIKGEDTRLLSMVDLLESIKDGFDDSGLDQELTYQLLSIIPNVLDSLPLGYEMDKMFELPIFQKMFPKTLETRNCLSLVDDILHLSDRMKEEPKLYRELKSVINLTDIKKLIPYGQEVNKNELRKSFKSLNLDEAIEKYSPKTKTSDNWLYDEITNLYVKIDLKGFKSDKMFNNMLDDANHTFYAATAFKYFLTLDDRCLYKAKEVYKQISNGVFPFRIFSF